MQRVSGDGQRRALPSRAAAVRPRHAESDEQEGTYRCRKRSSIASCSTSSSTIPRQRRTQDSHRDHGDDEPVITPVATAADIEAMRHLVREVPAASNVIDYALRIVRASRPGERRGRRAPAVRQWVKWGAGPRACQALVIGAQGAALLDGRIVASPDDVRAVATAGAAPPSAAEFPGRSGRHRRRSDRRPSAGGRGRCHDR